MCSEFACAVASSVSILNLKRVTLSECHSGRISLQTDGSSWLRESTSCTHHCCWSQALTSQLPRSSTGGKTYRKVPYAHRPQQCRWWRAGAWVEKDAISMQGLWCRRIWSLSYSQSSLALHQTTVRFCGEETQNVFPKPRRSLQCYFSTCAISVLLSAYWEADSSPSSSYAGFHNYKCDPVKITGSMLILSFGGYGPNSIDFSCSVFVAYKNASNCIIYAWLYEKNSMFQSQRVYFST